VRAIDYDEVVRELVDVHYPLAEKIVLVYDNLNPHKPASLYEAFSPDEAQRLSSRLEIHYTPKHGSRLNVTETELGILSRQCLDQRIEDREELTTEIAAWDTDRNDMECRIHWHFTTSDARIESNAYIQLSSLSHSICSTAAADVLAQRLATNRAIRQ
jgi:hypothetical protein